MAILHKLLFALVVTALAACAHSAESGRVPAAAVEVPPEATAALTCTSDAECVVKDIGNCCGYFPACVHRDQAVDPLAVRQRCIEQGMQSVCGFVEIAACTCSAGTCRPATGTLE